MVLANSVRLTAVSSSSHQEVEAKKGSHGSSTEPPFSDTLQQKNALNMKHEERKGHKKQEGKQHHKSIHPNKTGGDVSVMGYLLTSPKEEKSAMNSHDLPLLEGESSVLQNRLRQTREGMPFSVPQGTTDPEASILLREGKVAKAIATEGVASEEASETALDDVNSIRKENRTAPFDVDEKGASNHEKRLNQHLQNENRTMEKEGIKTAQRASIPLIDEKNTTALLLDKNQHNNAPALASLASIEQHTVPHSTGQQTETTHTRRKSLQANGLSTSLADSRRDNTIITEGSHSLALKERMDTERVEPSGHPLSQILPQTVALTTAEAHRDHRQDSVAGNVEASIFRTDLTTTPSSPTIPSATLTSTMGTPDWQQALAQQVVLFTKQGIQQAELHLHPQELGKISIQLQLKHDQVQLHFVTEDPRVTAALQATLPHLRTSLAESGMQLGNSDISHHSAGNSSQQFGGGQQQNNSSSKSAEQHNGLEEPAGSPRRSVVSPHSGRIDIFA